MYKKLISKQITLETEREDVYLPVYLFYWSCSCNQPICKTELAIYKLLNIGKYWIIINLS